MVSSVPAGYVQLPQLDRCSGVRCRSFETAHNIGLAWLHHVLRVSAVLMRLCVARSCSALFSIWWLQL